MPIFFWTLVRHTFFDWHLDGLVSIRYGMSGRIGLFGRIGWLFFLGGLDWVVQLIFLKRPPSFLSLYSCDAGLLFFLFLLDILEVVGI